MSHENAPFEIHVHGDVKLRPEVGFDELQQALRPLWKYAGARSLADAAESLYEDEPGIRFDSAQRLLQMCWTLQGDEDFRSCLDDLCMNLNELADEGTRLEITFYDAQYDEDDEEAGRESRDDFVLLFVGPTPMAIMQAQRNLLVEDLVGLMERHFDASELSGVIGEVDRLFENRYSALTNSLDLSRPKNSGNTPPAHGGGTRRPRHLH